MGFKDEDREWERDINRRARRGGRDTLPTTAASMRERAAKVADAFAQKMRDEAAQCKPWSAAQGERMRALSIATDIAEAIRALPEEPA